MQSVTLRWNSMARLNAKNNVKTVLSESVSDSDTEIVVENASILPEVPFRMSIGGEIVEVSEVIENTLAVERGKEDTTPKAYESGEVAECRMTAGMYNETVTEDELEQHQTEFNSHKKTIASQSELGHVKVDGDTISINDEGVISSEGSSAGVESVNGKTGKVNLDVKDIPGLNSGNVEIGDGASSEMRSVSIGGNTESKDTSIALGLQASAAADSALSVGYNSEAGYRGAFALGHLSVSSNLNEGVLGTSSSYASKWSVPGSFSVSGSKNFEIPHPHPDKKDTHRLRHSTVESPTEGDNLYRYTVEAKEEKEAVEMDLPDYFKYLNKNVDVWVNGEDHFGNAYGKVDGNTLRVTCELPGKYNVLVIGTRQDGHQSIQDWQIKGVEREIGESWIGETYAFSIDEIIEVDEIKEVSA